MIDPQFIIKLSGKEFVLFAGLLDAATKAGLKSIATEVVQIASAENGRMAVMQATVEFADGRTFQAVGDASPESCGRMIHPHVQRMAETRSIGRALRWALNVSVTMREELGDEDAAPAPATNGRAEETAEARPARHGQQCQWPEGDGTCPKFLTGRQCADSQAEFQRYLCPAHSEQLRQVRATKAAKAQAAAAEVA